MSLETTITLSEKDYLKIKDILHHSDDENLESLEVELDRAIIVAADAIPSDLVTMNSKFVYKNVTDNKEQEVTIVYPNDAKSSEGKISILAPLGAALIGLKIGQKISWPFPDGKTRELVIDRILYQPEASGDLHL